MTGTRIVLVEAEDRRRHVLTLARASATAELVADWAEQHHLFITGDERTASTGGGGVRLPSLRDFVAPRPSTSS